MVLYVYLVSFCVGGLLRIFSQFDVVDELPNEVVVVTLVDQWLQEEPEATTEVCKQNKRSMLSS